MFCRREKKIGVYMASEWMKIYSIKELRGLIRVTGEASPRIMQGELSLIYLRSSVLVSIDVTHF